MIDLADLGNEAAYLWIIGHLVGQPHEQEANLTWFVPCMVLYRLYCDERRKQQDEPVEREEFWECILMAFPASKISEMKVKDHRGKVVAEKVFLGVRYHPGGVSTPLPTVPVRSDPAPDSDSVGDSQPD